MKINQSFPWMIGMSVAGIVTLLTLVNTTLLVFVFTRLAASPQVEMTDIVQSQDESEFQEMIPERSIHVGIVQTLTESSISIEDSSSEIVTFPIPSNMSTITLRDTPVPEYLDFQYFATARDLDGLNESTISFDALSQGDSVYLISLNDAPNEVHQIIKVITSTENTSL